jgi:small ligand-binding sensory domain FIST
MPPLPFCRSSPRAALPAARLASVHATSFSVQGAEMAPVRAALAAAGRGPAPTSGAILFATGHIGQTPERLLSLARAELGPIPIVLGVASGVLTERGEYQGASAVTGITWRGGRVAPLFVSPEASSETIGHRLAEQARAVLGDASGSVILLAEPHAFSPHSLDEMARLGSQTTVIGAGTLARGAFIASAASDPAMGAVVGLALQGKARPAVRAATACRVLAPLARVTEARGPMVLRLGGEPALDRLAACASGLAGRPLVLAVLCQAEGAGQDALLVRGIRGVDPGRRGVVVTDEATEGMWMGFAVCDGAVSRANFASSVRDLERHLAGGAPDFGLLMTCAGRGAGLYGEPDVESTMLRQRFPRVPFAGMFSSFEIGPFQERPAMHLYTGVLAVFASPS